VALDVPPAELRAAVRAETDGSGANVVFECAGNTRAAEAAFSMACPNGKVLLVGCPPSDPKLDMAAVQIGEITVMGIFRYANVYPPAIRLLASGSIDLTPIITDRWEFADAVAAFDYSCKPKDTTVKSIIRMPNAQD
jgi:D-xylulose reductase